MVAGHVVPLDPVRVKVVEDGEAGLGAGWVLASSAVVGLGQAGAEGKQKYLRRRAKYLEKAESVVLLLFTHPPVCDQWGLSVKRMVLELGLDQPTSWLAWSTMPPVQKNRCASWAISRLNSFCLSGVSRDTGSMPARDTC